MLVLIPLCHQGQYSPEQLNPVLLGAKLLHKQKSLRDGCSHSAFMLSSVGVSPDVLRMLGPKYLWCLDNEDIFHIRASWLE